MNPLELVTKTLYSFEEKELAFQVLESFGKKASTFNQYNDVAKCFFELKNFERSVFYAEKSLNFVSSIEESIVTKRNLINSYNQYNFPEKAFSLINDLKNKNIYDQEIMLEETFSLSALNRKKESAELLFKLLEQKLDSEILKKAYHNLSDFYFRKDDIHNGLKHFLKNSEEEAYKNKEIKKYKKWNGEIIKDKTIIIDNECGAGDEVMHVRFMHNLKELGMNPIWLSTRKELVELFNLNGYNSVCVWDNPEFPEDSVWVYSLALPYHLNLKAEDLWKKPYLKTNPRIDKKWEWIKEDKNYKVGLFWASSSGFEQNSFRSVNLSNYMEALRNKNFSLYSLQIEGDNEEADEFPEIKQSFCTKGRSYDDTFSIINNLDLIITSCSFTAHVAASLGKEVCVFTPILEYYSWTSSTGKPWWYGDNVHIFRQKTPRNWNEPTQELKEFLNEIS